MLIGSPNRVDVCTLSGGTWTTGLPLSYMLTRQLDQRGRSVSASRRDTWFYAVAPSAIGVAVAGLFGNNFSTSAQVRYRGWTADPRPAVDGVFVHATMPSGFALTRASSATYFGSNGLLQTATSNVARFEYSAGGCKGLLIEPAATNVALWCRDLTNAVWQKSTVAPVFDATGVDGVANSATNLLASGNNATVAQDLGAALTGVFSVYLRRAVGTGTVWLSLNGGATKHAVTLTASWQRFTLAGTLALFSGGYYLMIGIDVQFDEVDVDFAQWETTASTTPTSPILTTSAAATRAAETLTFAGASATSGALVVEAELLRRPVGASAELATFGTGAANAAGFRFTTGGVLQGFVIASSAEQVTGLDSAALSAGDVFCGSISWATNDVRASFEGAAVLSDTSATMPASLSGAYASSGACYYLRYLRAYTAAKTTAQLRDLSGGELEVAGDGDSGWIDAWHAGYISGTTAEEREGAKTPALYKPSAPHTYRYWRVDVDDESNAAGYVEIGRPFLGGAWQPGRNASYGAGVGFRDRGLATEAYSGARYFEEPANPRVVTFAFEALTDAEAWGKAYELLRQRGSTKEVLYSWDPTDGGNLPRHTFLGTLGELDALAAASFNLWTKSFRIEELL